MNTTPFGGCGCSLGRESCNCVGGPVAGNQGRVPYAFDPYANEPSPRLVAWLDRHPVLAPVLMVAFILLALGVGGWIDHGGPL
jgi:hypothetical protein